jgi:universal stress protein E
MAAVDPVHPKDEQMTLDKRLLDFAGALSKALSGALHVYHTYQATPVVAAAPSGAVLTPPEPQLDVGLFEKVEAAHKASLAELVEGYELPDDRVHLLQGDAADKIADVIEANDIGVVVAGAISRSWLDRLLVGSTAESLLDAVSCDLVLLEAKS